MRLVSTVMAVSQIPLRCLRRAATRVGAGSTALVLVLALAAGLPLLAGCQAVKGSAPPPETETIIVPDRSEEPAVIPEVTKWPYAEDPVVPDGYKVKKRIKDVTFPAGSATLNAEARGAMNEAIDELKTNSAWHVLAVGFSDGQGESAEVAKSRAAAVITLLKSRGIGGPRVTGLTLGSAYARAGEFEPETLARDRRVEIWAFAK